MKYLEDYGLTRDPFDSALPMGRDVFLSRDMTRMQDAITRAVKQNQMLRITGPRGGGKTTTALDYLQRASDEMLVLRNITVDIENMRVAQITRALLDALMERMSITEPLKRTATGQLLQLNRLLGRWVVTLGRKVVLFLEDGHDIPLQTLVNLKRLMELDYAGRTPLLSIILITQPQIRGLFDEKKGEQVGLRLKACELQGLARDEVPKYLAHRISAAGGELGEIFTPKSIRLISQKLHWPLEINKFCGDMLEQSWEIGEIPVSEELVEKRLGDYNSLRSMYDVSDLDFTALTDSVNALFGRRKRVHRADVMLAIDGKSRDTVLVKGLQQVLLNRSGDAGALYDPDLPGATADERDMVVKINDLALQIEDLDYEDIARRLGGGAWWSAKRVHDVLTGVRYDRRSLEKMHTLLTEMVREAA